MSDTSAKSKYEVLETLGVFPIGENAQVHSRIVRKDGHDQLDLRLFTRKTARQRFYRSPFGLAIASSHAGGFGGFVRDSLKRLDARDGDAGGDFPARAA